MAGGSSSCLATGSSLCFVFILKRCITDKKSQSNWKLPSSSVDLDRKDSSVNPSSQPCEDDTSEVDTLPDTNDQKETTVARHHNCCKKEKFKEGGLLKIKEKIKNAIKIANDKVNAHRRQNTVPYITPPEDEILSLMSTIFYVLRRLGTAANLEAHSLGDITQADETLNERADFCLLAVQAARLYMGLQEQFRRVASRIRQCSTQQIPKILRLYFEDTALTSPTILAKW
ncbi:hypothetical protein G5I_04765 [Acromyrmex echinatior]|uniref:Uncharacterized protein n=1 Tax=Acromyrmex echinatior TaxID=103372 RepID=F4WGI6_ACREC|nr:hypothetical protein G5I_04765 [Acromyrmex echinatior]